MARDDRNSNPGFLWQGTLILLPVVLLSVIGFFSLREDRALAERDAVDQVQQAARRLSVALQQELKSGLEAYLDLSGDVWAHLRLDSDPSLEPGAGSATNNSRSLADRVARWEEATPKLSLRALCLPAAEITSDGRRIVQGRFMGASDPSGPPSPPDWLQQLSVEQWRLWEAAASAGASPDQQGEARAAVEQFLATNPPEEAAINAKLLLARIAAKQGDWDPLAELLTSRRFADRSPAGLPVAALALYECLRLSPEGELPPRLWSALVEATTARSSALTPALLAEADRVSRRGPPQSTARLEALRTCVEKERSITRLEMALAATGALTDGNPGATWVAVDTNAWLALLEPSLLTGLELRSGVEVAVTNQGHSIRFVPGAVVSHLAGKALAAASDLVPDHMEAGIDLAGAPLRRLLTLGANGSSNHRGLIWGEATETVSVTGGQVPLRVEVSLADPEAFFARQRKRVRLFGLLIGASAVVAMIGLVVAQRAFQRQLRLGEMKSNFVSSVSHELRAPIASVRLLAESLEQGRIPELARQQEYFRLIGQECRRLSALIENVLDFARIEQGRKRYEFEPTDLAELVRQTVRLMEPAADARQVTLAVRIEPSQFANLASPPEVDGRAIQQALVNLLDNAIKYSPTGKSVTVSLELLTAPGRTGSRSGDGSSPQTGESLSPPQFTSEQPAQTEQQNPLPTRIQLWVEDEGPGIPAEEHERIFERFYRRGSELRRETQGVGIGLSLVKHIAEAHGGVVTVWSAPGQGSRFTIELPLKPRPTAHDASNP